LSRVRHSVSRAPTCTGALRPFENLTICSRGEGCQRAPMSSAYAPSFAINKVRPPLPILVALLALAARVMVPARYHLAIPSSTQQSAAAEPADSAVLRATLESGHPGVRLN